MKKWNVLISMLLLAGVVFTTSCSKDEEEDPGPSLNLKGGSEYVSDDVTISAGETIKVGVMASSSSVSGTNLSRFKMTSTFGSSTTDVVDTTFNEDTFTQDLDLTFSEGSIGTNVLKFEVWDKDGKSASREFTVTVEDTPVEVTKHADVELGSWNDAAGSFYSSSTNQVFVRADVRDNPTNQALVDFIFFKGTANANSLAAPADNAPQSIAELQMTNWTVENATKLAKVDMTVAAFDAIGATFNFDDFDSQATIINNLNEGDIIQFLTVEGKMGLIKVKTLANRGDYGVFDVIVQN